jgi:hypothetical protein
MTLDSRSGQPERLAAAITEATGQEFSDAGVQLFAASLVPEMTLNDALRMLSLWNRQPHSWSRVAPGDLNELWRMQRPAARLTRNEIDTALIQAGLDGDALWLAARQVPKLVNQGIPFTQAVAQAAEQSRGRVLEPPERKPRKHIGRHFAGRIDHMNLNDVLGEGK